MAMVAEMMARGTVRRGLCASSASGADDSKPANARKAKMTPCRMPSQPPSPGSKLEAGLKVAAVLPLPASAISQIARATKTTISMHPRMTEASAEILMPK